MTRLLIIFILSLTLFSCNNKSKESQLKEKELATEQADTTQSSLGAQAADVDTQIPPIITKNTEKSKNRKLRFLHYSNVDLRAYFDDGTIITCPRCDLTKENVENLQSNLSEESLQTYELKDDGSLLIDGWKHEYPYVNKKESYEGWAMINYKWFVKY
jgi:hypothetical protein|tara:strand:+ start:19 stop:492 length:474 start_codon:yes stop_codon:yes gene_type:complete